MSHSALSRASTSGTQSRSRPRLRVSSRTSTRSSCVKHDSGITSTAAEQPVAGGAFTAKVSNPARATPPSLSIFVKASSKICTPGPTTGILSAADRFTHRWPRPRALLKNPSMSTYGRGTWTESEMRGALIDCKGLGVEGWGKWSTHKWCLLFSVATVFVLAMTSLVISVLTWFAAYPAAPPFLVTDPPSLILLTFSSCLLLLASVLGLTGILLNSRPILAVYVLLLFPACASFISVGYVSYHKAIYSLDGKLSQAWNDWYTPTEKALLQNALSCCGWADPLHAAAQTGTCYPRAPLLGCRDVLGAWERKTLATLYGAIFALVPLLIVDITTGLLCANHVTHRFGKGITPKQYRLNIDDLVALSRVNSNSSPSSAVRNHGPAAPGHVEKPGTAKVAETGAAAFREDKALPMLPPGL